MQWLISLLQLVILLAKLTLNKLRNNQMKPHAVRKQLVHRMGLKTRTAIKKKINILWLKNMTEV